ncbi:MAG: hypothetical protein JJV95_01645 [Sulfurospirillum sp.]|nr:hypothetical protein [Sulfurospirillum sp.]MBL0702675.1 hypothetical protein [Sulfurospirillum sp.]
MKHVFISMILVLFANGTNLLTHNIYERTDRVDVMLSFDSPYEGEISQKRGANTTTLTLSDLTYDKLIENNINSTILQDIIIQSSENHVNVTLKSKNPITVIASKTVDGFGLRIRTKPLAEIQNNQIEQKTPITTKVHEDLIDERYISVILVLSVLILFMLWLRKKVTKKGSELKNQKSWLFKSNSSHLASEKVNILHQKPLDNSNSVVLLEFQDKKYLVMTGASNLLLEKFSKDDIKDDSDFEKAFEDNRKKLDEYLKIQQKDKSENDYRSKLERD